MVCCPDCVLRVSAVQLCAEVGPLSGRTEYLRGGGVVQSLVCPGLQQVVPQVPPKHGVSLPAAEGEVVVLALQQVLVLVLEHVQLQASLPGSRVSR